MSMSSVKVNETVQGKKESIILTSYKIIKNMKRKVELKIT
jgi:hypothetical protein